MKRIHLNDIRNESYLKDIQESNDFVLLPFFKDGKPLFDGTVWGMTLKSAGSMRFRWNETNENREKMLSCVAGKKREISQVQLDHTKIVTLAETKESTTGLIADGIVTVNEKLMPVVTIADCTALYLYEPVTGAFGIVHSGWKGTGIVTNAINMMKEKFGVNEENILCSISACIHNCCYIVTEDRADYFAQNFSKSCVTPLEEKTEAEMKKIKSWAGLEGKLYRLSLVDANLALLKKAGIKDENIALLDECTCCNENFGSNRRETQEGSAFTVQAAFVRREL